MARDGHHGIGGLPKGVKKFSYGWRFKQERDWCVSSEASEESRKMGKSLRVSMSMVV